MMAKEPNRQTKNPTLDLILGLILILSHTSINFIILPRISKPFMLHLMRPLLNARRMYTPLSRFQCSGKPILGCSRGRGLRNESEKRKGRRGRRRRRGGGFGRQRRNGSSKSLGKRWWSKHMKSLSGTTRDQRLRRGEDKMWRTEAGIIDLINKYPYMNMLG